MRLRDKTPEQIVAAIHAKQGVLQLVASELGCTVDEIERAAAIHPEIQDAIDSEKSKLEAAAELKFRQAVLNGQPWAVKIAYGEAAQRPAKRTTPQPADKVTTLDLTAAQIQFCYERIRRAVLPSVIREEFDQVFTDEKGKPLPRVIFFRRQERATKMLLADAAYGLDVVKLQLEFRYWDVVNDEEAARQNKNAYNANVIKALGEIGRLRGLLGPMKVALTDPTGEKEYAGLSNQELAAAIVAEVAKATAGGGAEADTGGETG